MKYIRVPLQWTKVQILFPIFHVFTSPVIDASSSLSPVLPFLLTFQATKLINTSSFTTVDVESFGADNTIPSLTNVPSEWVTPLQHLLHGLTHPFNNFDLQIIFLHQNFNLLLILWPRCCFNKQYGFVLTSFFIPIMLILFRSRSIFQDIVWFPF